MIFRLPLRGIFIALAALLIVTGGALALVQFERNVGATFNVSLKTDDGIEVYLDEGLTQVADSINFGDLTVDVFGTIAQPQPLTVWIHNRSNSAIRLGIEDDLDIGGVELSIVSRFSTTSRSALTREATTTQPVLPALLLEAGEVAETRLEIHFSQKPPEANHQFTVTFVAQGPVLVHDPAYWQWKRYVKPGVVEDSDTYVPTLADVGEFDQYVVDSTTLILVVEFQNTVVSFRTWVFSKEEVSLPISVVGDDGVTLYVNDSLVAGRPNAENPPSSGTIQLRIGWNKIDASVYNGSGHIILKLNPKLGSLGILDANASYDSAAPEEPIPAPAPTPVPVATPAPPAPAIPAILAGTVNIAVLNIDSFNGLPRFCTAGCSETIYMSGLTETLFGSRQLPDGTATTEPMLALDFTLDPNFEFGDFNLRQGVQFHEGYGEMTSEDVAFSYNDANSGTNPASIHGQAGDFAPLIQSMEPVDDYTLRLNYRNYDSRGMLHRFSSFWQTAGIVSKAVYNEQGVEGMQGALVGVGPYVID